MSEHISAVLAGSLQRETIIDLNGNISVDQPGGDLLYAAEGYQFWGKNCGLLARVGEDFPEEWVVRFRNLGFNTEGIKRLSKPVDLRVFFAILDENRNDITNPMKYFGNLGQAFPKSLLGYSESIDKIDSRNRSSPLTLHSEDIPKAYLDVSLVYLGPLDYIAHNILPTQFRAGTMQTLIIKPSIKTMNPAFWYNFPALIRGATVLICTKATAKSLFLGHSDDLWEIARTIANSGVEIVVITCGADGQIIYDRSGNQSWEIPAYPVKVIDNIHASDAFAGGFLAGYQLHFDPLIAAMYGNVTASIKVQGSGPFYLRDTLAELAESRLNVIKSKVIKK